MTLQDDAALAERVRAVYAAEANEPTVILAGQEQESDTQPTQEGALENQTETIKSVFELLKEIRTGRVKVADLRAQADNLEHQVRVRRSLANDLERALDRAMRLCDASTNTEPLIVEAHR